MTRLRVLTVTDADDLNWFKRLRLKLWWGSEAAKALRAGFVVTEASIVQTNRRGPSNDSPAAP